MAVTSLMNTYGNRSTTLVKGEGIYVWDDKGNRYLDAISGIAVCGLGYSHPAVTQAICEQASTLVHCSNLYLIEPQLKLGDALTQISGLDKVFFSNSGAEANEAAIKIARKYGHNKGIAAPEIITTEKSFHGRTLATLSATGNPKIKEGFAPLVAGFKHAAYDNIESIEASANNNTVAVMVEPIQGEGGVNTPDKNYLKALRELCDKNDWLLILDEIQTGNGRTGTYFAYQQFGIQPDVLTTAKGLGNGVPIGACLTGPKASNILQPGNHGSTFGGNPLACSAGLAVVHEINSPEFLSQVQQRSQQLFNCINEQLSTHSKFVRVKGLGLMIGIELNQNCTDLVEKGKTLGILINVTAENTIRLLPPLIISEEQVEELVSTLVQLINQL